MPAPHSPKVKPMIGNQAVEDLWRCCDALYASKEKLGADNKRLREALRWTAGALQAACVAGKISETDMARMLIGTESRTYGQILDAANAALAQGQEEV